MQNKTEFAVDWSARFGPSVVSMAGAIAIVAFVMTRLSGDITDSVHLVGNVVAVVCLIQAFALFLSLRVGRRIQSKRLLESLALRGSETALDLGCGDGLFLHGLARRLPRGKAIGLDIWRSRGANEVSEEQVIREAKQQGSFASVDIASGDLSALPFETAKFDLVVSSMAAHGLSDPGARRKLIQEIARIVRPGGRVALQISSGAEQDAAALRACDFERVAVSTRRWWMLPPVRVVTAIRR